MYLLSYLPALAAVVSASLSYKGVDWSSVVVEEDAGQTYIGIDGNTKALEHIIKNNGANIVRQRLWYDPSDGYYNLDYNLEIAKRAQAVGLDVYLDIFFSDTWTDPSNQATPSAWAGYDVDDLATAVQNYTESVMNSFQSAGLSLAIVAIGNEITEGLLWDVGDMEDSPGNLATLLHAASAGIKDSTLATQPKILIHIDNGWDWDTQEWWYDTVLAEGPLTTDDYDIQGVSYYPFYNEDATLASLKSSLTNMVDKYGKEVMVVETDWPQSCPDPEYSFPSDTTSIPISTAGQTTWMQDVAAAVEDAGGNGLFYWEPAWIDNAALGSSCANNLMFASNGQALASIEVFSSI